MTANELHPEILSQLPFSPNPLQSDLSLRLAAFVSGVSGTDAFILNGYAGTGKTSLGGALIRALKKFRKKTVLLAPTGRAAKIAAGMGGGHASTIHRRIYHQDTNSQDGKIVLSPNRDSDTLFIVDEASMISDDGTSYGSLLKHLVNHIMSKPGNRILFMGDLAQLPPVGQSESHAMNPLRLRELGLTPETFTLDLPERQHIGSGILRNATNFRHKLFHPNANNGEPIPICATGFPDIEIVSSYDLADVLSSSWSSVGIEETIIITRSNRRANNFNSAIRNTVMMAEEPLQKGDRLVISKNDYYWSKKNNLKNLIANGETCIVTHVGRAEKMYGRYFSEVDLRIPSEDVEITAFLMLRSLISEGPSVPREELNRMYQVALSMQSEVEGASFSLLAEDPYINALQAKYAYCVTCHKAQGGQWRHVYIDMGSIPPDAMTEDFWRWLYTAVTRTTEKVFFINPTLPVR